MNMLLKSALLLALGASAASAQLLESEFQKMKWNWSAPGMKWLGTKIFQYAGDYGYYQDNNPSYGVPINSSYTNTADWRYVYYGGLTGKRVYAWGQWGLPSVKPPYVDAMGKLRDGCMHTHVGYGVWMYYSFYSGGVNHTGWVGPLYGGNISGTRVNNYTCSHSVTGGHDTWGKDVFTFDFPKTGNIWQTMILGGMAYSHGANLCPSFQCVNQPWLGAYTVSY
jgi:hypothetical protein